MIIPSAAIEAVEGIFMLLRVYHFRTHMRLMSVCFLSAVCTVSLTSVATVQPPRGVGGQCSWQPPRQLAVFQRC